MLRSTGIIPALPKMLVHLKPILTKSFTENGKKNFKVHVRVLFPCSGKSQDWLQVMGW
jgi:hypothetical protein